MCNPADPEPCTSGTPSQAQIDNDHRSLAQRQHDAFLAVGRIALMCGELGQLNGLPVSIIIRTTLEDLESRAGIAVTGGGTKMPIKDVIRLAAHANLFLAVFNKATGSAMDLFRARRIASLAQRIMLIGREGGCTKPGCTVGPYGCQVHHAVADWADDGNTNVDEMTLACGTDNRMVDKNGGWTTRMSERHEVEWIPPPHLDTGQARVNYYHTPERLLTPDNNPEPQQDNTIGDDHIHEPAPPQAEADEDSAQESFDRLADISSEPEPELDEDPAPEPFDPWADVTPTAPERKPDSAAEPLDPWASHDDTDEPASAAPDQNGPREFEPFDPWGPDIPVASPDSDTVAPPDDYSAEPVSPEHNPDEHPAPESFASRAHDTPAEPGGPAPPDHQAR